ncbi:nucleotidyltransferase family protein [Streptomyces fungicidicus]|uniref:Nucleotidyltransferase family protein n=1 Tax=Streptomyces fungicidicus TaxID=68203 RepID=A0ACC7XUA9_9ACTN|nr:nucleotidyltransferase family protein [Streptomyces fungicidicus]NUV73113.1 nucleotidyltransferase family protein [Streptomyces fungicidicus]
MISRLPLDEQLPALRTTLSHNPTLLTVPDRAAVGTFAATTCRLGIRLDPHDHWRVYAPHGLAGIFTLVLRPNPVLAPREVYEAKAERWQRQWPELRVLGRPKTD